MSDSALSAALSSRRTELTHRSAATLRERDILAQLASSETSDAAREELRHHRQSEEGEAARAALKSAEGDEAALRALAEKYPDWSEPPDRLATLRYFEGKYTESAQMLLGVLREKPWHFAANHGLVMTYEQLAKSEASTTLEPIFEDLVKKWKRRDLPLPGPEREAWVRQMLPLMDAKLADVDDIFQA